MSSSNFKGSPLPYIGLEADRGPAPAFFEDLYLPKTQKTASELETRVEHSEWIIARVPPLAEALMNPLTLVQPSHARNIANSHLTSFVTSPSFFIQIGCSIWLEIECTDTKTPSCEREGNH